MILARNVVSVFVLLLLVSTASAQSISDHKVYPIVSYPIPLLVESEGSGFCVSLFREAARRAHIQFDLALYPTKRAMQYFEEAEAMAIMPALPATLAKQAALTRPIFSKRIHGIVRTGGAIPRSIEDLKGKRVGLVLGFAYPESITKNTNIVLDYANTTEQSLRKMIHGRLDVVVADGYTASKAMEAVREGSFEYDLSLTLDTQPVFIAFQPSAEGRELAKRMSVALDSIIEDGTYALLAAEIGELGVGMMGEELSRD